MPSNGLLIVLVARLKDKSGSGKSKKISTRNLKANNKSCFNLSKTKLLRKNRRMKNKMKASSILGRKNFTSQAVT